MSEPSRSRADYKTASRAYYKQTDKPEDHWIVEEAHAQMLAGTSAAAVQKDLVSKGGEPAGSAKVAERAGELIWKVVLPKASSDHAANVENSDALTAARHLAKALAGEHLRAGDVSRRLTELGASDTLAMYLAGAPEVAAGVRSTGWTTIMIGGAFTAFAVLAWLFDPSLLVGLPVLSVVLGPGLIAWGLYARAKSNR